MKEDWEQTQRERHEHLAWSVGWLAGVIELRYFGTESSQTRNCCLIYWEISWIRLFFRIGWLSSVDVEIFKRKFIGIPLFGGSRSLLFDIQSGPMFLTGCLGTFLCVAFK